MSLPQVALEKGFCDKYNSIGGMENFQFGFIGGVTLIKNVDNVIVGCIEYLYYEGINELFIEKIEILSSFRRKCYARSVINELQNKYPNCSIIGQSVPSEDIKYRWERLGAQFESCLNERCLYDSFDECEDHCDNIPDYTFTIPARTLSI